MGVVEGMEGEGLCNAARAAGAPVKYTEVHTQSSSHYRLLLYYKNALWGEPDRMHVYVQ